MARFGTACGMIKPVKVFVPPVQYIFDSCKEELRSRRLHVTNTPQFLSYHDVRNAVIQSTVQ